MLDDTLTDTTLEKPMLVQEKHRDTHFIFSMFFQLAPTTSSYRYPSSILLVYREMRDRWGKSKILLDIMDYINSGNTVDAVNFPNIRLPKQQNAHRFLHIHQNVPGIIKAVSSPFSTWNMFTTSCRSFNGAYLLLPQQHERTCLLGVTFSSNVFFLGTITQNALPL